MLRESMCVCFAKYEIRNRTQMQNGTIPDTNDLFQQFIEALCCYAIGKEAKQTINVFIHRWLQFGKREIR